jgi:hypothetical protein
MVGWGGDDSFILDKTGKVHFCFIDSYVED